jgi:hypothetical protein
MILIFLEDSALPDLERRPPSAPLAEVVLRGIANWVSKFRSILGLHDQLGQCRPDEVKRAISDLGLAPSAFSELVLNGSDAADLLQKMLVALHVDPNILANTDPQIVRDLRRMCITCSERKRCVQEVASGAADQRFREFCPRAFTFDVLFGQKGQPPDQIWQDISNAPIDCDLELAFIDRDGAHALIFPCRRIADGWAKSKTKERIDVRPSHWRKWRQTS